jgi:hypothetical protein
MSIPRLSFFSALAVILIVLIWYIAPAQLPVILYKLALVTLAAVLGYWLDRHMFPYARPMESILHFEPTIQRYREYRRVAFVVGTMIAFALAL